MRFRLAGTVFLASVAEVRGPKGLKKDILTFACPASVPRTPARHRALRLSSEFRQYLPRSRVRSISTTSSDLVAVRNRTEPSAIRTIAPPSERRRSPSR